MSNSLFTGCGFVQSLMYGSLNCVYYTVVQPLRHMDRDL